MSAPPGPPSDPQPPADEVRDESDETSGAEPWSPPPEEPQGYRPEQPPHQPYPTGSSQRGSWSPQGYPPPQPPPHQAPGPPVGQPPPGQAPYGPAGQAPYGQPPYRQGAPYAQAPYGQAPYGQGAPYGQASSRQPPYGQAPYGQAPYAQAPYGQAPYGPAGSGGAGRSGQYPAGYANPSAPGGWPTAMPPKQPAGPDTGMLAVVLVVLAALASLGYALWAFTARRGVFADFGAGRFVAADTAKSSDTVDTTLLVIAGLVAVAALGVWVRRRLGTQTAGGGLDLAGLALSLLGVITIVVGLFLASRITDAAGQVAQGDRGVTATVVTGAGFMVLAVGFLVGSAVVRGGAGPSQAMSQGYPAAPGQRTW